VLRKRSQPKTKVEGEAHWTKRARRAEIAEEAPALLAAGLGHRCHLKERVQLGGERCGIDQLKARTDLNLTQVAGRPAEVGILPPSVRKAGTAIGVAVAREGAYYS
jgi:hypothetical protein